MISEQESLDFMSNQPTGKKMTDAELEKELSAIESKVDYYYGTAIRDHISYLNGEAQSWHDHLLTATTELATANARIEVLEKENKRSENTHLNTIDERDDAEQSLSQAYYLVTGNSPEWSNLFGHQHALIDIEQTVDLLKQSVRDADEQRARADRLEKQLGL